MVLTFSEQYLRPEAVQADDTRMRIRLEALFDVHKVSTFGHEVATLLRLRLGVEVPFGTDTYWWHGFFTRKPVGEVLDLVTVVHIVLGSRGQSAAQSRWRSGVQTIFDSLNMKYNINEEGEVILRHDREFEEQFEATIAGLQSERYRGTLEHVKQSVFHLESREPDTRAAVRAIFDAVENVFKLMFAKSPTLSGTVLQTKLRPMVQRLYASDVTAERSAQQCVGALAAWVDACHVYRHAPGHEEPRPPPLALAVVLASGGTAHLRWLVSFDSATAVASTPDDSAP